MKKQNRLYNDGPESTGTTVTVDTPATDSAPPSGDTNVTVNTGNEGSQEGK